MRVCVLHLPIQAERELLRNEIAVMKLLKHPFIVRLEAVFETRQSMYIVLEKVNGGELFSRIVGRARFTESEARELLKPLLQAVAYIHSIGIIHRDIKVRDAIGFQIKQHIVAVVWCSLIECLG